MRKAKTPQKDFDNDLKFEQHRYKENRDQHVSFAAIVFIGDKT